MKAKKISEKPYINPLINKEYIPLWKKPPKPITEKITRTKMMNEKIIR